MNKFDYKSGYHRVMLEYVAVNNENKQFREVTRELMKTIRVIRNRIEKLDAALAANGGKGNG